MKISCQNCSSKYTVSDEKVQGKTVKLKCKKCGATILVNAGGATTVASGAPGIADHASAPAEAASTDGTSYLVNVADGDQRTMTIPELVAAYQSQVVTADTYVWADGMGDWQPLGQVEPIVSALSAGAPAAAPAYAGTPTPMAVAPMAAAPPAASSAEAAASAASLAASASARPAARRETGKRADVFGNEKSDDVATSAPLFSASAKAAASSAAAAAKTGQREENSVLFSLSALTSKPGAPPAAAPSRKDSREDSGLIDLRALAASAAPSPTAASASAAAIMGHDDGGLFPLGVPAQNQPAAPPVAANVSIPPPASKAPMFIGIGALVAALAIVGVFFAMKGGEEKPVADAQPAVTTPAAQPTPTQTAAPAATPEPTATAAASASASATATAAVAAGPSKGGSYKPPSGGGKPASGGGKPASTSAAPASTPAKPRGNCGCAAGDLMCAMKCSAGGK